MPRYLKNYQRMLCWPMMACSWTWVGYRYPLSVNRYQCPVGRKIKTIQYCINNL